MVPDNDPPGSGGSRRYGRIGRRRVMAAGVALGTGVAGCGGGDSNPTDTRSPTSESMAGTPTESPSPTATETASDPEPLVVEDFAEDSLEGYEGATNDASITSDAALSGDYALEDGTGQWGDGSIYRVGDLPYQPQAGDTFRVGLKVRDYGRDDFWFWAAFHWAVDPEKGIENQNGRYEPVNCYTIVFDTRPNFTRHENGDFTFRVDSDAEQWSSQTGMISAPIQRKFPEGEWTEIEIDWGTDGEMDLVTLDASGDEVASISATGIDFHQTGGIGFEPGGSKGHFNYWDYVRITDRP